MSTHRVLDRFECLIAVSYGTFRGLVRVLLGEAEFLLGSLDRYVELKPLEVRRLVFVCLGNINRSAFAVSVATSRCATALSVGLATTTGARATNEAVVCASGFGIDLGGHSATNIADYDFVPGDLLLVMETRHARRLIDRGIPVSAICLLGHWSSPHRIHLHDPHTLDDSYFRTCFALISSAVHKLLDELAAGGSPCVPETNCAMPSPQA